MIHATCVAFQRAGVLIRGPSGSGKSDLAVRLIDRGAILVADDYVTVWRSGTALFAAPPARLQGLIEMRGLGPVRLAFKRSCVLGLAVDLVAGADIERLPEPEETEIEGVRIPCIRLDAFEASATAKVRLALYRTGDTGVGNNAREGV